jgi:hypothetical protein
MQRFGEDMLGQHLCNSFFCELIMLRSVAAVLGDSGTNIEDNVRTGS